MRIFEGFWDGAGLTVWGMDSERPALTSSRKRVRPHPYGVDHAALAADLPGVTDRPGSVGSARSAAGVGSAELWLPSLTPRHPQPPPEMPDFPDAPTPGPVTLRRWDVPTVHLTPTEALAMLRELGTHSGDIVPGASLRHFAAIADAAALLVDARRVIPQLVEEGPWHAARWRPVLDGRANAWLRDVVRALPPVALAHQPDDLSPTEAGDLAMGDVLLALCAFTDATVRARLAGAVPAPAGQSPRLRDMWLHALTDGAGDLDVRRTQRRTAEKLREPLRAWFSDTHAEAGEVRLAFRLLEPPEDGFDLDDPEGLELPEAFGDDLSGPPEQEWALELWVQSTAEPSLMVTLRELWDGDASDWLPHGVQNMVLRSLGRAARIYPALSAALEQATPTHLRLDLDGAYQFLGTHAAELGAAGFGVLLPKWAGEQRVGLTLTTRTRSDGPAGAMGMAESLITFDYRAAVGDTELGEEELAELARLKQPLVRLRGEWARLDPKALRAAAQFLRDHASGTVDVREAVRMAIAAHVDTDEDPLPLTAVDADGELGALLDGSAAQRITPMAEPDGFTARLRPYQRRGVAWLAFLETFGLGAILADDMGLGKTVQMLALLAAERESRSEDGHEGTRTPAPTLLVCPVTLIGNWQRETERFAPGLRVHVHHGADRPRGAELAAAVDAADVVLTSYGLALRDAEELAGLRWGRVVCDEAQAIKNPGTRLARAVRAIPAPRRVALTGTPVENHLGELWSIMEFTNPGLLGSRKGFRSNIATAIESASFEGTETPAAREARRRLGRVTRPFILRRLKTDTSIISDLPEKQEIKAWCTLTPEQASLYRATVNEMMALVEEAEGIKRHGLVLATLTRLKQVCNHPAHLLGDGSRLDGRSGKLEMLCDLLAEMIAEGDKALCFTQYTDFGDRLAPYLAARLGARVLWLHGGIPRTRREEMVRDFQESPEPMVFLLSLRAGGTGLNLTAANQVVHIDRWWNPAVENQATDRAFRIGQHRNVQVRKLICLGTLEERVDAMMERKSALAETVVGNGEDWLGDLSGAELREVVRLAPEAVEG